MPLTDRNSRSLSTNDLDLNDSEVDVVSGWVTCLRFFRQLANGKTFIRKFHLFTLFSNTKKHENLRPFLLSRVVNETDLTTSDRYRNGWLTPQVLFSTAKHDMCVTLDMLMAVSSSPLQARNIFTLQQQNVIKSGNNQYILPEIAKSIFKNKKILLGNRFRYHHCM